MAWYSAQVAGTPPEPAASASRWRSAADLDDERQVELGGGRVHGVVCRVAKRASEAVGAKGHCDHAVVADTPDLSRGLFGQCADHQNLAEEPPIPRNGGYPAKPGEGGRPKPGT